MKGTGLGNAALAFLLARPIKVIHLYRRDPLAAYLSHERMRRFRVTHSSHGAWSDVPKIRIDIPDLTEFARQQASYRARVGRLFPDAVPVAYEALPATFPAILDHLEVPPHPWVEKLDKLAPVDLRDAIENHDEARAACSLSGVAELVPVEE